MGDIKPPECAAIWCIAPSDQNKYGIKYDSKKICEELTKIELDIKEENGIINKGFDAQRAKEFEEYIDAMIEAVKNMG